MEFVGSLFSCAGYNTDADRAGSRALNLNNDASNSNDNNGSRLTLIINNAFTSTGLSSPLGENETDRAELSKKLKSFEVIREKGSLDMKRKGYLYDQMCDKELIKTAIRNAAIGKKHRTHIQKILDKEDYYADEILRMLQTGSFAPSPYKTDVIFEGMHKKRREISKPKFYPDQVVHWCIYLVLKPWLFNRFYALNCGSIPGRGVHYGKKFVERWLQEDRKCTKYYLKMDVHHFYQSIQPQRVMVKLRKVIKDERFLKLNEDILMMDSGLPIGMLLSQVYANFFLTELDFEIKQLMCVGHYIRYMDDMVAFGSNKKKLHYVRERVDRWLRNNGLQMKPNWQVCRLDKEPLDFMGFRFYRKHTGLRRSIMLAITRKARKTDKAGRNASYHDACSVMSYLGWIKCTNSYNLFCKWIRPYLHIQRLKNIIRRTNYEKLQKLVSRQTANMGFNLVPG